MHVRLPVVVIGSSLTAIDTATESLRVFIPCRSRRCCRVTAARARAWRSGCAHRVERRRAQHRRPVSLPRARDSRRAGKGRIRKTAPRILELLQSWGGVTIAYRRRLIDSPSYTLNHEEVEKALEEGIRFAEGLTPLAVKLDPYGHARALKVVVQRRTDEGKWVEESETELAAKTILVAAGTQPNTVLAREDPRRTSSSTVATSKPSTIAASRCGPKRYRSRTRCACSSRAAPTGAR